MNRGRKRARELTRLIVLAAVFLLAFMHASHAEEPSPSYDFDIKAETLGEAMQALSRQARKGVLYPYELADTTGVRPVVGRLTITEALTEMLRDTNFSANLTKSEVISVSLINKDEKIGREEKMANGNTKKGLLASVAALFTSVGAAAQDDASDHGARSKVDVITVTAQKREESAQDVPQSIQTFSAADLEKIGFTNITDIIDKTPSLNFTFNNFSTQSLLLFMRGVQTLGSVDSGVGIYIDDMYLANEASVGMDLVDIERIEILPGPQGTLYGRNTIGGAVKFVSAKPTGEWGLKQSFDYGNYSAFRSSTHLNIPEVAGISAKFSMLRHTRDGWVRNTGAGPDYFEIDSSAYRAAIRWAPTENFLVDYSFDYSELDNTPSYQQRQFMTGFFPFVFPLQESRREESYRPVDLPLHEDLIQRRHQLTAAWDFKENLTLKSITGYLSQNRSWLNDSVEAFNLPALQGGNRFDEQWQQELLLSGNLADDRVKFHLGLFYYSQKGDVENLQLGLNAFALALAVPFVPPTQADFIPPSTSVFDFESKAVYGQVSFTPAILDDRLRIDVGGRYSEDKRLQDGTTAPGLPLDTGEQSYDSFDPSVTIDYAWAPGIHTYARYATGFRAGGFNLADPIIGTTEFGPESLTSYEIGVKSLFADDRVLFNLNGFWTEYEDIQFSAFVSVGVGVAPRLQTINGGSGEIKGFEGEFRTKPVDGLTLGANVTFLDATADLTNPDTGVVTEQTLAATPKWSYTADAEYVFPPMALGELSVNVSYDFTGQKNSPTLVSTIHPSCKNLDARAAVSDIAMLGGDLTVALWAKNLTDNECQRYHAFDAVSFATPRTYGVNLTARF